MHMSAVCLLGTASRRGFEIIRGGRSSPSSYRSLEDGDHVWTEKADKTYTMYSRTDEADEATISILNARTDHQLGAFASEYGFPGLSHAHNGGECMPVATLRDSVEALRRLSTMLEAGDFSEANPLPNGLVMSPFAVAFNLWLVPAENTRGFSPVMMTCSLYCFLVHQIITRALANRPLFVCNACGDFQRSSRRDSKFCSGRCRTANFRAIRANTVSS